MSHEAYTQVYVRMPNSKKKSEKMPYIQHTHTHTKRLKRTERLLQTHYWKHDKEDTSYTDGRKNWAAPHRDSGSRQKKHRTHCTYRSPSQRWDTQRSSVGYVERPTTCFHAPTHPTRARSGGSRCTRPGPAASSSPSPHPSSWRARLPF